MFFFSFSKLFNEMFVALGKAVACVHLTLASVHSLLKGSKTAPGCLRKVLRGGPRRTCPTGTSRTWSTLMDSTSSASTGSPRAHPSKSPLTLPPRFPGMYLILRRPGGTTCSVTQLPLLFETEYQYNQVVDCIYVYI